VDGNFRYIWLGCRGRYGGGVIATRFGCRHGCLVFYVQNLWKAPESERTVDSGNVTTFHHITEDVTECD
jgi:hypothetical protein